MNQAGRRSCIGDFPIDFRAWARVSHNAEQQYEQELRVNGRP